MNSQDNTTTAATAPVRKPWFEIHAGGHAEDQIHFMETQLRCAWLALSAEPGLIDDKSICAVKLIVNMVEDGLGDLRVALFGTE